jgi:hypothetical protein
MLDAQPPIRGTRDVRIDFFRGLALYMILVDHVVGDPIGKLTFRSVGFSDAAELFVFLSGISCAIVYSGVLARRGWGGLLEAIARRASYIYLLSADVHCRHFPDQDCRVAHEREPQQ